MSNRESGESPARGWLRTHRPALLAIAFVTLASGWLATYGTWRVFDAESFGGVYDAQARSLLAGHWDMPLETLGREAFLRDGKWYTYFGCVPALARIPLLLALPHSDGRWSRLSVVLAVAVSAVYAYRIALLARRAFASDHAGAHDRRARAAYPVFILSTTLGSTCVFLASRTFVYHEAVIWGGALALASFAHLLQFLSSPRSSSLLAAAAFALAAFFTRATVGGGPILALTLLGLNVLAWQWRWRQMPTSGAIARRWNLGSLLRALNGWPDGSRRPSYGTVTIAGGTVLLAVAGYVGLNHLKFDTWFEGLPMWRHYEAIHDPARLKYTGGRFMDVRSVRTAVCCYFSPVAIDFSRSFPWVHATQDIPEFREARIDKVEWYTSVPASMPALFGLGIVGAFYIGRRPLGSDAAKTSGAPVSDDGRPRATIVLLGALAGGISLLPCNFITHRYVHDFFPILVIAAAYGMHVPLRSDVGRVRRWLAALLVASATTWGVYVNSAMALTYQCTQVWGVPRERAVEYWYLRWLVDGHVSRAIWPDLNLPGPP
jgi:hypothetical protein